MKKLILVLVLLTSILYSQGEEMNTVYILTYESEESMVLEVHKTVVSDDTLELMEELSDKNLEQDVLDGGSGVYTFPNYSWTTFKDFKKAMESIEIKYEELSEEAFMKIMNIDSIDIFY